MISVTNGGCVLCLQIGRRHYLDIGVLSGFTCLLLGLLGCRSRTRTLLPNRNYISGNSNHISYSLSSYCRYIDISTVGVLPTLANYRSMDCVAGYIVLAVFSLLNCGALLALLVWGGTTLVGTPADVLQGAVWGLGALCLVLASAGALASCCCSRTPPDNRVQDI